MSDPSVPSLPGASPDPTGNVVRRRAVLAAGLATTGGVVFGASACTGPEGQDVGSDSPDEANPKAPPALKLLRLKINGTESPGRPTPKSQVLDTPSLDQDVDLVVTSTNNRVWIGRTQEEAATQSQPGPLTVRLPKQTKNIEVWVSPRGFGPPLTRADRIEVRRTDPPSSRPLDAVDVWIEPTGGQWEDLTGTNQQKLHLGIVPIHAALMRKTREDGSFGAEVVMYSHPRLRNKEGKLVVNKSAHTKPEAKEQWYWPVMVLKGADLYKLAVDVSPPKISNGEEKNLLVLEGTERKWDATDENKWAGTESSVLDLTPPKPSSPWDLNSPTPVDEDLKINIFCSGQAHQPDGQLLTVGGHLHVAYEDVNVETRDSKKSNDTNGKALHVYGRSDQSGQSLPNRWQYLSGREMPGGDRRWYPTVTALPDGRMLITTGANDCFFNQTFWNTVNETYVVYDPATGKSIGPVALAAPERRHGRDKLIGWGQIEGQPKDGPAGGCEIKEKVKVIDQDCADETSDIIRNKLSTYSGVFVLPRTDGQAVIAVVESNRAWLYDYVPTNEAQPLKLLPPSQRGSQYYPMKTEGMRTYPWYGSMVLLPLKPAEQNSKVKILAAGGQNENDISRLTYRYEDAVRKFPPNGEPKIKDQPPSSTKTAEIFEFDPGPMGQSGWQTGYKNMNYRRILCDATLLADGMVLISGGAEEGWTNENPPDLPSEELNELVSGVGRPVKDAELFDPEAQVFTKAARAKTDRRYHSVALLLPDGTVLKTGSTGGFDADFYNLKTGARKPFADSMNPMGFTHRWFLSRTDAERYFPPYLWRGPRPKIEPDTGNVVRTLQYGQEFTVVASGPSMASNAKIALIRLGAVTHGIDMDQRYVWLKINGQQPLPDNKREITAVPDKNPAFAPPGDYMLVVVDSFGVPSEGEIVTVSRL